MPCVSEFFGIAIYMYFIEWALAHRGELRSNWALAREQLPLARIEPLE